jgi:CxxC motif-containing protein (DUF1111 family)
MKPSYLAWYLLVVVVALVPAGVRVLTWRAAPALPEVDANMAYAGQQLFLHEFTPGDPLCPGGDGLGPVFNANSCVACHKQGGIGGSGGREHNVTVFTVRSQNGDRDREGVIHAFAVDRRKLENLQQVHPDLEALSRPPLPRLVTVAHCSDRPMNFPRGVHVSQRNTPALFGVCLIDALPERVIVDQEKRERLKWGMAPAQTEDVPVGRALRLANGHIGRFGWKGQTASLSDFVQAACANELGLGNPGQAQPRPLSYPDYQPPGLDLTTEQCDQLTAFCASLPRPTERWSNDFAGREAAQEGKKLFRSIGCADCHTPKLGDIDGIYSDLLLHRMGQPLEGGGSYNDPPVKVPDFKSDEGPQPGEWRTPPLWGVADSAPYLHDGRATTLAEAIELHGGQAARSAQQFMRLMPGEKMELIAFLQTLHAP